MVINIRVNIFDTRRDQDDPHFVEMRSRNIDPIVSTDEYIFSLSAALVHLAVNGIVSYVDSDIPEETNPTIFYDCSGVFVTGNTDREIVPIDEIEILYRMWRRDPLFGSTAWSVLRRRMAPIAHLYNQIAITWDVDALLSGDSTSILNSLRIGKTKTKI